MADSDEVDDPGFYERRRVSFGGYADVYAATRPSWPEPTLRWLTGDPAPGSRVLDLGAGTGKGTVTLVEMGLRVTALEPSEGMLRELQVAAPSADGLLGSAESIPLPDSSVRAVVALQAWHWFDSEAAAAECARVLEPGGSLGVAWHVRDESVPWVAELARVVRRHEDWSAARRAEHAPAVVDGFGPYDATDIDYELVTDVEGLAALASSWSYVRMSPDREARLDGVRALGAEVAAGSEDGLVHIPHRTRCYRFPRLPAR